MLLELNIKDFAIIDRLSITFGPGLNIFTGSTGAGKSIIMEALSLILGDRASNDVIRSSMEEAQVEAMFDVSSCPAVIDALESCGMDCSGELVIKRVIQRAGKNRVYINGGLATLSTLADIGGRLIDVCGQSEHQTLTRAQEQLEMLDSFGAPGALRGEMREAYQACSSVKRGLDSLIEESKTSRERKDLLSFQLKEISDADPLPGEDVDLKCEKDRLQNAGKIKGAVAGAEAAIYSESGSAAERLGAAVKALREISAYDRRIAKTVEALESSLFAVEDAASFLRGYSESAEADPDGLERAAARLDLLGRLKKKYGPTLEEVMERKRYIEKDLSGAEDLDERIKGLSSEFARAQSRAKEAALALTLTRKKSAAVLEKEIEAELSGLGMKGASFKVAIETDPESFNERGSDRVGFLISPNPGEEIKPLAKIASGGELSRIMLAIKRVSRAGRAPTLVFDEIDAGVGGAVAQIMGLKLKEVAGANQVICITHMPQIAAFADTHFSVSKSARDNRTVTSVTELKGDERVGELSEMLGGLSVTETTIRHAGELIAAAGDLASKKKPAGSRQGRRHG
ncbi:MAG: DNA repair protein RecN [Deltaproteobacteria bacterium]|nr:DNA repair protein RecN [Deltaproteobacteria bacterium]